MRGEIPRLTRGTAWYTVVLEDGRGERNSRWSGEMRRDLEEHRWRRRLSGPFTDAEVRKLGEQTGLDTPVVLAVNDEHLIGDSSIGFRS